MPDNSSNLFGLRIILLTIKIRSYSHHFFPGQRSILARAALVALKISLL